MKRREFLKYSGMTGMNAFILGNAFTLPSFASDLPDAVQVSGGEPSELLHAAFRAYGGIQTFISKNDKVVIKPNMGWDRAPQFAANTNPELVAAVSKACFEAGASEVKIFDRTCNNPRRCYRNSKIQDFAEKAGAEVEQIRSRKFKTIPLPNGEILKEWEIYEDYLEADKIINLPIAKHHSLAKVSLGLKNLMGVMGGNRGNIHNNFETKLIDVASHILPTLTIVDAYRILLRNGPVGGNLNDVKLEKKLIMSRCTVTADYLALNLFGHDLAEVRHLQKAYDRQVNLFDPKNLNLKTINL